MTQIFSRSVTRIVIGLAVLAVFGVGAVLLGTQLIPVTAAVTDGSTEPRTAAADMFIKFDGVDGESKDADHEKWIELSSFNISVHRPGAGASGQSRRRGSAVLEDVALTMEYEKASPKLHEAVAKGKVFPKVEIHLTASYGGARATYLKYELKNVMITSYQTNASSGDVPVENFSLNFEEIKETYTEYGDDGSKKGNVEFEWKVEKGE